MEDLIRRQDAIEKLCKRCQISNDGMCEEGDCIDLKLIRLVPSVEVIPVEWINKRLDDLNEYIDEHGENHMVISKIQEAFGLSRLLADWQEQKEKKND